LLGHLGTVTVAALSRTIRDVASEVAVGPDQGLPAMCAVNMHNVFTLRREDLGRFVATLPPEIMAHVDRALVFALGVGEV
jgi:mRNA interferase MazF